MARMRTLIVLQHLTRGKLSSCVSKNCIIHFEDGNAKDATGNGNKVGTTGSQSALLAKQKSTISASGQLEGSSCHEEQINKLQQQWKCKIHLKGPHSPTYCYSLSGDNLCYLLTISNLKFWALQIMKGMTMVDEKPLGISTVNARLHSCSTVAPPPQVQMAMYPGFPPTEGYGYPPVWPWGGNGQIYPPVLPSEPQLYSSSSLGHHVPSPPIQTSDILNIVGWFSSLNHHEQ
ncbi:hypothetical protein J3A83DRAFT_4190698 [Scleroderma citrinum]